MRYGVQEDGSYVPAPRIQDALSALLMELGFESMAQDVLTEGDLTSLRRYALVIAKNLHKDKNITEQRATGIVNNLKLLRLL